MSGDNENPKREVAFDEPLEHMKRALKHDEARRATEAAVAANKAVNASKMLQASPERMRRIATAQRLRTELGGFAMMPPDVRANPIVREKLWPKVVEYAAARLDLSVGDTCEALVAELALSKSEASELLGVAGVPADARVQVSPSAADARRDSELPFDTTDSETTPRAKVDPR